MNNAEDLEQYHAIWDGTEDWVLVDGVIPSIILTIEFEGESPNARELIALRKAVGQFRDRSLRDIKEQLRYSKSIEIGSFTGYRLRFLVPMIKQQGLSVKLTDQSYTGYIPYHRATGNMLMNLAVENRDLFTQIVQKLLLKGVPILAMMFEID